MTFEYTGYNLIFIATRGLLQQLQSFLGLANTMYVLFLLAVQFGYLQCLESVYANDTVLDNIDFSDNLRNRFEQRSDDTSNSSIQTQNRST